MFKIGEFSKLGQVSTRMLRHYDKLGLLTPSETDKWTGYRFYTIDQLARLHRIIAMKDLGFSLPEIGELLADEEISAEQMRGMLTLKKAEVQRDLALGQMRLQNIESRLAQIEQHGQPSPYEIVIKAAAGYAIASVRDIVPSSLAMGHYCEMMTARLYEGLKSAGIRPLQPESVFYHNEDYVDIDLDVEVTVAVHPKYSEYVISDKVITFREVPAHELVAALIYEGALRNMAPAVLSLVSWVALHEHVPTGPLREIHMSGPVHAEDVVDDELVTELMLPIAKVIH